MKRAFILLFAATLLIACNNDKTTQTDNTSTAEVASPDSPVLKFEKEVYDFGTIKEGDTVQYAFKFTNTGKTPLIISSATATCGCTIPETPALPIQPGAHGEIKVVFDSTAKPGLNDKIITVTSNAVPAQSMVHLMGTVTPK